MVMTDIRYVGKNLLKSVVVFLCILIIPASVTIALQGYVEKLEEITASWPAELVALCGVTDIGTKEFSIVPFYMLLIILNMVAICRCVSVAVAGMIQDEESGMIKHYINQPYTRVQIYMGKLGIALISALVQWFEYCAMMAIAVAILCHMHGLSVRDELSDIFTIAVRGLILVIFLLSICILFIIRRHRSVAVSNYLTIICTTSLFAGNIYKVFDLIGYYMRRLQGDDSMVALLSGVTKNLRIVFPFTLLNVLNTEKEPLPDGVYWIYLMLAVAMFVLGGYIYGKKDFS